MNYITSLFPHTVITYETDLENFEGEIYPEEEVLIFNAVEKRKKEFTVGRLCAKKALSEFGIYCYPVLMNKDRSPIWPEGIVGSITHTMDYCGIALARKDRIRSVGLDAEIIDEVKEEYREIICSKDELDWIFQLPSRERQRYLSLFFSAKECFYKFQYPLTREWVGFKEVRVLIEDIKTHEFKIILLKDINEQFRRNRFFNGNYFMNNRHVVTGMFLTWSK